MRKFICSLFAACILFSCSGCSPTSYKDTNGDTDYTLQTITEENIRQGMNTSTIMSSAVTFNNKTVCKAKAMSGVLKLFDRRMEHEPLDIVVSCDITKGNARLVLLLDGEIIHDFSLHEENQHFSLESITGKVCLKLAGESAAYAIAFELQ